VQNELRRLQEFMASSGSCSEGDGFYACFKGFLPAAQEKVSQLHETCLRTLATVDATAVSFGEAKGSTKPEEWFAMLFGFSQMYRAADEKVQRRKRLQEPAKRSNPAEDSLRRRGSDARLRADESMGRGASALPVELAPASDVLLTSTEKRTPVAA
jgi:hypothetical protein